MWRCRLTNHGYSQGWCRTSHLVTFVLKRRSVGLAGVFAVSLANPPSLKDYVYTMICLHRASYIPPFGILLGLSPLAQSLRPIGLLLAPWHMIYLLLGLRLSQHGRRGAPFSGLLGR